MREYRTGYRSAPCSADRLCKPGNVARRIHVGVQPCSAQAREAVLLTLSDRPANRARLAGVGRFHKDHAQGRRFRFIGHEVLKLAECPPVQPRPDPSPAFDAGSDVAQVFHSDFSDLCLDCFCNDSLACFVVDVLDMPRLTPGDSPQFTFGCAATVGLKTTAMGKVDVSFVSQFTAAPDLAGAGCSEIVFAHVDPECAAATYRRDIGKVENKIEVPDAPPNGQTGFLGDAHGQKLALMLARRERDLAPASQREQGKRVVLEGIRAPVEVNRRGPKGEGWNRLVLGDALVGLERFVSVCNTVYGLANHLATKCRETLSRLVIHKMMQRHPVPASMFLSDWNDGVARLAECARQRRQRNRLLGGCL